MASTDNNIASFNMRPNILIVDDDIRISDLLYRFLMKKGCVPMVAHSVEEAKKLIDDCEFDLIILDIMMPGQTGLEFARELQKGAQQIPIIFLTALGEVQERIEGLRVGADDYISKPFDPNELLLRVHAVLKRTMKPIAVEITVQIGALKFDVGQGILTNEHGDIVVLTDAERELLLVFAKHNGEILSRDQLASHSHSISTRAIDVQITRLRKKIENENSDVRYLQTVRGQGYVLRGQLL